MQKLQERQDEARIRWERVSSIVGSHALLLFGMILVIGTIMVIAALMILLDLSGLLDIPALVKTLLHGSSETGLTARSLHSLIL